MTRSPGADTQDGYRWGPEWKRAACSRAISGLLAGGTVLVDDNEPKGAEQDERSSGSDKHDIEQGIRINAKSQQSNPICQSAEPVKQGQLEPSAGQAPCSNDLVET